MNGCQLGELIGKHNSRIVGVAEVHGGDRYNLRLRKQGDTVSLWANSNRHREMLLGQFPACETLQTVVDMMLRHPKAGRWTIRLFHQDRQSIADAPMPGRYVQWIREARAHLAKGGTVSFYRCGPQYETAAQFDREIRAAVDKRINLRGTVQQGRKHSDEYQTDLLRDSLDLRDILQRRIRVYQFRTPEVRAKFGHLLARYDD